MLQNLAITQMVFFSFFVILERLLPNRKQIRPHNFGLWWLAIVVFALIWLRLLLYYWAEVPVVVVEHNLSDMQAGFAFYLLYSFGNYWFHRWKHANGFLWKYIHRLHHSPSHMETPVAFFRHPGEIFVNTLYLIILGKTFGVSADVLCIALTIEGCLECFHHSNIKTPKWLRPLGYIVQLPEMHLVHHEYKLHRYNYAPIFWDGLFGTARVPCDWQGRLGFDTSNDIKGIFLFRK